MYELNEFETEQVSGGLGPLAIIGIDLPLNGLLLGWATLASSNRNAFQLR